MQLFALPALIPEQQLPPTGPAVDNCPMAWLLPLPDALHAAAAATAKPGTFTDDDLIGWLHAGGDDHGSQDPPGPTPAAPPPRAAAAALPLSWSLPLSESESSDGGFSSGGCSDSDDFSESPSPSPSPSPSWPDMDASGLGAWPPFDLDQLDLGLGLPAETAAVTAVTIATGPSGGEAATVRPRRIRKPKKAPSAGAAPKGAVRATASPARKATPAGLSTLHRRAAAKAAEAAAEAAEAAAAAKAADLTAMPAVDAARLIVRQARAQYKLAKKQSAGSEDDAANAEMTFPCPFPACGKSFGRPSHLKKHLCIHTGERNFKCKRCPKSFKTQWTLTKHTRIHTGEKPFSCEECDMHFTQRGSWRRHIFSHHRDRVEAELKAPMPMHRCPQCSSCYKDAVNLAKHLETAHQNTPGLAGKPRAAAASPS